LFRFHRTQCRTRPLELRSAHKRATGLSDFNIFLVLVNCTLDYISDAIKGLDDVLYLEAFIYLILFCKAISIGITEEVHKIHASILGFSY
jgi:hypothetical protein